MKKVFFLLATAALIASCNGNKNAKPATAADSTNVAATDTTSTDSTVASTDSLVYEGTVPAADCAGIRYRIAMDAQKKNFTMQEDYMETETKVKSSFNEKGTVAPYTKNGKKGLKLTTNGKSGDAYYFINADANTLRMVNDEMEEAVTGNYDLKLKK